MVKSTSLAAEFVGSLKSPWAEELVDLAAYRPLGFVFVKLFRPFPITPNQISCLAMLAGIAGGVCFAGGSRAAFVGGALLYGLSNILDCCDGMIARLKKNGTATGRIVDGIVDYVSSGAVYVGLAVGLSRAMQSGALRLPCSAWLLVVAAAVSTAIHAVCSDYYRTAFLSQRRESPTTAQDELRTFGAELERLNRTHGHAADKAMIWIYLKYLGLQTGKPRAAGHGPIRKQPETISPLTVALWNLIGPSTHISFLIAAAVMYRPGVFFVFTIGLANAWMTMLTIHRALRGRRGSDRRRPRTT